MKKIFGFLILLLFLSVSTVLLPEMCIGAKSTGSTQSVQSSSYEKQLFFNNKNFYLKHVKKTGKTSWMNEYYKLNEKEYGWKELVTVHYFGHLNSTTEYAKKFTQISDNTQIMYNDKNDVCIVTFILGGKQNDKFYLEQNFMKIKNNSDGKGLIVFQYARKIPFNTDEQKESANKRIKNSTMKFINLVLNADAPEIVQKEQTKW